MNSKESSKVRRLARVVSRANEVFDDAASAVSWLESPNAALRGNVPLRLLDTNISAESVLDALGRIEHGVFVLRGVMRSIRRIITAAFARSVLSARPLFLSGTTSSRCSCLQTCSVRA